MAALSNTKINPWLVERKWPDTSELISLMDRLFNRMDGMYPNKWRAAFANPQAIKNWREAWAEAFIEEGITPDEVMAGISSCRKHFDWPPSLPEFMRVCRPVLDYERAFLTAVEQMRKRETNTDVWPDAAVYWAACKIGNDLFVHPYSALKTRWNSALDESIKLVKSGELPSTVPLRRAELPVPGRTSTTKEQAKANIAKLRDMLAGSRLTQSA